MWLAFATTLLAASALNVPSPLKSSLANPAIRERGLQRRALLGAAAAAALPLSASAAESKEAAQVRETVAALSSLLDESNQKAFVDSLASGDASGLALPAQIPFTVFQKLEKTSDPEFMEAAIDYAEA